MISTINVSLPSKLKLAGDKLVSEGYFASFSDLVRVAMRGLIDVNLEILTEEAIVDFHAGKTKALNSQTDIDEYLKQFKK